MTVRFGIVGCGRIGRVHAASLARVRAARLVAVADAFDGAANALAAETGAEVRATSAILASDDIDAVIVGTPTDTHFDLIGTAAAEGKAIFCEKPIDLSIDRVRACLSAVEAAGVAFMTGFNRRFDPHFADLARRLHGGAIGTAELVIITSRDPSPPPISYIEASGGLFRDMMIHDLDLARFLLRDDPVAVFATGSSLVDPAIGAAGDVDTAAVTLTFASGALCQITNSRRAAYGYDQRIEVHGATGMLRAENVLESQVEQASAQGFVRPPAMNFFLERYQAAYLAEIEAFVQALETRAPPRPTGEDGLRAQILADAATTSWQTGQPVSLDPMRG